MLKAIVLAGALALASPAFAQSTGPDAVADTLFGLIRSGEIAKAYDGLGRGTVLDQKKLELQNVANQTTAALQIYGKVLDWELMSEKKLSQSYVARSYLLRTERGPIFFNLHLYRGAQGWTVLNIYFTDILKNLTAMEP